MAKWFYRAGDLARDGWDSVVDATLPGWAHTGLRIGTLADGERRELPAGEVERLVIPLAGSFRIDYVLDGAQNTAQLAGRRSVFDGVPDVAYLPVGASATVSGVGRVAVAEAPATGRHPFAYLPASSTPVELRGAGNCSRQVHNYGTPAALDAAKFIVCEVITPAGNWSSFPPHKHDTHTPGVESRLEEIYYFEIGLAHSEVPGEADPFGLFTTYSSDEREIDVSARVHTGDVALVPYGYHGPAAAAPGYHMYYLNVMAGPDAERVWNITDDPAHAWVRTGWDTTAIDPRLPYREEGKKA